MSYSITPGTTSVKEDSGSITFTVLRSTATGPATVYASTILNGGANTSDYVPLIDKPLYFATGVYSVKVTVSIISDTIIEPNQTFGLIIQQTPNPNATVFLARSFFTIVNDDSLAAPEITVTGSAQNIVDGDTTPSSTDGTNFGSITQGAAALVRTFTVKNDGGSTLTLGAPVLPAGFSLVSTNPLVTSLAPGASDTFQVQLNSATAGTKAGQISIATNDADESVFNFSVSGAVTSNAPEITVTGNTQNIVDGDTTPSSTDGTNFGSITQGAAALVRTFTVKNDGGSTLTLGAPVLPAGYSLVSTNQLVTSLAPGASDTFQVQLNSATAGTKSGQISIATNDADESVFNFSVSGAVTSSSSDIPASITTSAVLTVNGPAVASEIGNSLDTDWFKVFLTGGQICRFELEGTSTSKGTLTDPFMRVRDSSGTTVNASISPANYLGENDMGVGTNARLVIKPSVSGTYYVSVGPQDDGTGTYTLKATTFVPEQPTPVLTGQRLMDVARPHTNSVLLDSVDDYVLGSSVDYTSATQDGPWDCAEFVAWCIKQAYGKGIGIIGDASQPWTWSSSSEQFNLDLQARKGLTSINLDQAKGTVGALLIHNTEAIAPGHVGISDGAGRLFSAQSDKSGVQGFSFPGNDPTNLNFKGTYHGGLINDVAYNIAAYSKDASNTLVGGNAGDRLTGGLGKDTLTGNGGGDRFVFDTTPGPLNFDTIIDFTTGADKIWLDDDIFLALGVVGTTAGAPLPMDRLNLGAAAADSLDRIIYNQATGALFYDADGSGVGAALQIALIGVTDHPVLSIVDILVGS